MGLSSQGRDNFIHIYDRLTSKSKNIQVSKLSPGVSKSITTNSLNFCRFSLVSLPRRSGYDGESSEQGNPMEALLAVPSLLDSETVSEEMTERADVYLGGHLSPSFMSPHTCIHKPYPPGEGIGVH